MDLKQQLIDALGLTEDDFRKDRCDLWVRFDPRVMPWLRRNFEHWTIVQNFISKDGSGEPWPEGMYVIPHQ